MLALKNSMNFSQMAQDMITKINEYWTDPFKPPTVIFPDSMVEKWFKLYWLKTNNALLNLKFEKVDQFLFNSLQNDVNAKILSSEMLRLAIIKKLSEGENKYYKTLGEDVEKYLSDNGSINWNRLYDYSKTIADLLLEYERTRPCWDNSSKEDNGVDTNSPWYRSEVQLYNDLFTDGLLELNGNYYSTFNQLYKRSNGKFIDLSNPVFVFGFSGLGDSYIKALETISKSCDVIIYIQAAKPEQKTQSHEDCKQQAEAEEGYISFGKHGTAFLEVWETKSKPVENKPPREIDGNLIPKFVAAPSKIREIDKLHNEICKLLKNSTNPPMLSDIKVFAPNIKEYIPAISLVFSQKVKQSDDNFRFIPYSISDYSAITSNTYEAANILFRMFEKGYFSRADIIKLINNPVVQATRSITEDDVRNWKNWIKDINIYRSNRNKKNDWEDAKERLLLSNITNETIHEGLSPYDPIGCDNSTLFRFIDMIDTLEKWIENASDSMLTVESVKDFLRSMLSLGKTNNKSLKGERDVYLKVMGALSSLQTVFGNIGINYQTIFLMIMDSISGVSLSMSSEARGIEFITFKPGRIIPAKYTFFIGMDSNAFPGTDKKNVLDIRKNEQDDNHQDDESIIERNKNALYCQMQATDNEIRFSYVNKDLKKDADFYRSSVLNDIAKELGRVEDDKENPIEDKIGIDVEWKSVFTNRNKRDNTISSISTNSEISESILPVVNTSEPPKRVTISLLRSFLEEPLKFQIETAFGYGDDEIEKEESEYEPVYLDNLTVSNLRKKYIKENINTDKQIIDDLKSNGILFDGLYGEMEVDNLINEINNLNKGIKELLLVESLADTLNVRVIAANKTYKHFTDGNEWTIAKACSYFNIDYKTSKRIITINPSGFSTAFATALALLTEVQGEEQYSIDLYYLDVVNHSWSILCLKDFDKSKAINLLDNIFNSKWNENWIRKCKEESLNSEDLSDLRRQDCKPSSIQVSSYFSIINFKTFLTSFINCNSISYYSPKGGDKGYKVDGELVSLSNQDVAFIKPIIIKHCNAAKLRDGLCCRIETLKKEYEKECASYSIYEFEYLMHPILINKAFDKEFNLLSEESFTYCNEDINYSITGKVSFYNLDESSKHVLVVDFKDGAEIKDFLNGYVSSLAILSTLKDDSEYTLSLCLISPNDGKVSIKHICCTAEKAKQILNDIYTDAFITKRQRFLPIKSIDKPEISFEDIIEDAEGQNGSWGFFRKSRIIEIPDGLGYDQSEFDRQWKEVVAAQSKLIESLLDKEE